MGHYCLIRFSAKLNEVGQEIIEYLQNNSISSAAKHFKCYPVLKDLLKMTDLRYFPILEYLPEKKTLKVDWEHEDNGYDRALRFILPYLIAEKVRFLYVPNRDHWKGKIFIVEPMYLDINLDEEYWDEYL